MKDILIIISYLFSFVFLLFLLGEGDTHLIKKNEVSFYALIGVMILFLILLWLKQISTEEFLPFFSFFFVLAICSYVGFFYFVARVIFVSILTATSFLYIVIAIPSVLENKEERPKGTN